MKIFKKTSICLMSALLATTGCVNSMSVQNRNESAASIIEASGFELQTFKAGKFVITGWVKMTDPDKPTQIYIEGDGLAWISKREPSLNPTPKNPVALQLASRDSSTNVIYLARPCQYTDIDLPNNNCSVSDWTTNRFSNEIIVGYNEVLDQIIKKYSVKEFHITGYSGGANIAGVLAGQRHDIKTLRTVAGNLDNFTFTNYHKVSDMPSSINMTNYSQTLSSMPQIHYFGENDTIITPDLAHIFISKLNNQYGCIKSVTLKDTGHTAEWAEKWPKLSLNIPFCQNR